MPPSGKQALMAHGGTNGQNEGDGKKSPGHGATDQERKSNSGRAAVSN
jgi:hypothetical protein